ncbi:MULTISPECIES: HAD family phosphatase [unclassified Streptomyces]|uniref:HAD family hydrolase n=1 Tax=unclassified Streptomyces TaxID=2593676 RepID=UPI000DBA8C03|nr:MULTISPECIES: HAD family phosphatase [unclassified Streptomyces]MYT75213.1 HAD family phosphatase [Streptomyces sp. SID8367]RAJ77169.1 phosphoglycolate phosphatase-like HAD superfamily hydrolase [Streptomyces sp. PsTaAH-137]
MTNALGFARLRLVALNIDGVLLNDTFSPVIHRFITGHGGAYTADVERTVFSQPQKIAGERMAEVLGGELTGPQALAAYFREREEYLREHPVTVQPGAVELLTRLRATGLRTVCYGGLDKGHFDRFLGEHAALFDGPGYVCTDAIRPGLREITADVFSLKHDQALFVDDVARVAEAARTHGFPFVGFPTSFEHSFQAHLMKDAGVRHLIGGLDDIDEELLRTIDDEAATGTLWGN